MRPMKPMWVLYEDDTNYYFTKKTNYDAYIWNERMIYKFKKSEYTWKAVVTMFVGMGALTSEQIIYKIKEVK